MSFRPSFKPALHQLLKLSIAASLLSFAAAAPSLAHDHGHGDDDDSYTIGLWGDLPYSTLQATVGVPNLIADMNAHRLKFTAHDGDLKQGSNSVCDAGLYAQALAYFDSLEAPAMFTPGDNDWVDCDRPSNGGYNSRDRLDYERKVFFSTPFSLGQRKLRQEVQTDALCLGANGTRVGCVENRRWTVGRVTYATLNIQGSCNNLCDTNPDPDEYNARNAAVILWMQQTFTQAKSRNAAAVMFITQGNPGWDQTDPTRAPLRDPRTLAQTDGQPDGFVSFLTALRIEVEAFRKPVAYVHGDSHYFRVDQPFLSSTGQRLENFVRVETFGDNQGNGNNDVRWLKVTVDPRSRDVFSFQPVTVPANRTAVPAPARN
ncbi:MULTISPECIES: hypothetical protein [unclassified Bradyrhizobium]|uniref:hypothetical protein n=1 Tax=unclassified Bradyrhizobium TaxID=2631580 RepID=UPI0028E92CD8|nr:MULTISPECIES: hypothetical protein [unclassified Bradyrhizobium]